MQQSSPGLARLALAPALWLAHFTVLYVIASLACERLVAGAAIATVAALAAFLVIGIADYRRWRESEGFVSLTSALVCALSALAALWVAYPAFVLPPCA